MRTRLVLAAAVVVLVSLLVPWPRGNRTEEPTAQPPTSASPGSGGSVGSAGSAGSAATAGSGESKVAGSEIERPTSPSAGTRASPSTSGRPPSTSSLPASPRVTTAPTTRTSPTSGPGPTAAAPRFTSAVPSAIPAHCESDVSPKLQAWIASVPDGSTLELGKGGCYRIDATLLLADRRDLMVEGNGATLRAMTPGDRNRAHLRVLRSAKIVVRNLTVRGANPVAGTGDAAYQPQREAQHAFELLAVDDVLLDHVSAYDVYGDFVYVGGSGGDGARPSRRVRVQSSRFERNGRQGISVTNGEDVTIVGNVINEVRRSMFDLEPNHGSDEARRILIEGNTTGAGRNFWIASKGVGVNIGDVTARSNVMSAPTGGLVFVFGYDNGSRGPFNFVGNRMATTDRASDEGSRGAFLFAHCAGINILSNEIALPAERAMPLVELRSTSQVRISDNHAPQAAQLVVADAESRDVHAK